jgi:hypothetical protein
MEPGLANLVVEEIMTPRRLPVVALVLSIACVAGWAARPAAARTDARDNLMKTSLLALQGAVDRLGAAQMYVYPAAAEVVPGGGLRIKFWPRDPWTGRRLTPGSTRGHYTYTRAADRRSYVLVGYLRRGRPFVVKGRMAYTPVLAYDHRGWEGLNLIYEYVREWSSAHAGELPSAAEVTRYGAVGTLRKSRIWPSNPWDHAAMEQRDDPGSFGYTRSDDGLSFTLVLHQALGADYVLTGQAVTTEDPSPRARARGGPATSLVRRAAGARGHGSHGRAARASR